MRSITTISEWIKSRIKSDIDHKLTSGRQRIKQEKNRRRGFKRYINPKIGGHTVCIGKRCPSHIQRPKVICTEFTSLYLDTRSNIFCKPHKFAVDSDSFMIGIDNNSSTTISNRSSHFIGTITPVKGKFVNGFGSVVQVKGEGMIIWKIEDDDEIVHSIKIKKALYVPEALSCLLAPKQWAQQENENYTKPDGTWCSTKDQYFILFWK